MESLPCYGSGSPLITAVFLMAPQSLGGDKKASSGVEGTECACRICLFHLSCVSVIVDPSLDLKEKPMVCLELCSVSNLVRPCWYSSSLRSEVSKKHQTLEQVTKAYQVIKFTTLMSLLEVSKPQDHARAWKEQQWESKRDYWQLDILK